MPLRVTEGGPPATDREIRLPDGRRLGYAEYGDLTGKPVFFFHGWPSSRLFLRSQAAVTAAQGVRVIACERPGFGLSDFQPKRQLLDWPVDVLALADALGIDRFAVAGHSGGGPYAAACAFKIPSRVTAAAIISGLAPLDCPQATGDMMAANRLFFGLARRLPWLHRLLLSLSIRAGAEAFLHRMIAPLAASARRTTGTSLSSSMKARV